MILAIELFLLPLVFLFVMVNTIRRSVRPSGGRRALTTTDEERMDPGSRQWMAGIEAQLGAIGFSTPCRMLLEDPIVSTIVSVAEHDGNLVTAFATLPSRGTSKTGISFCAGLGDGRRVVTTCPEMLRYFPYNPRYVGATFVGPYNVAELYDIHRFQAWEYREETGIARLSRGATVGEAIAYEDREADFMDAFLVKRGIHARTGSTRALTWKGAFLVLCRAVFPWRQIALRQRARRRAAILTRYRAAVAAGWTPDQDMRPAT